MRILYSAFIGLMKAGFFLGQFFNEKISQGYKGRKQSLKRVRNSFTRQDAVIWMHAASLGEYEQGLPVLEELKSLYPCHKILVTFFSPSGYEHVVRKNHPADAVAYLPFDSPSEVRAFLDLFQPKIFFTVKYDYWYNLLALLKKKGAKTFSVSANFYPEQIFFKPYGGWFVRELSKNIDCFFHQTESSLHLAQNAGLTRGLVSGDTRFDRVRQFLVWDNQVPGIQAFRGKDLLVVFGSAWEGETGIAAKLLELNPSVKIILAPHDLNSLTSLKKKFPGALCYSEISDGAIHAEKHMLLIDSIGLLSRLYAYADISVVGGGFHSRGLHNILEAAVYGRPVLFGSQYRKNPEADTLVAAGGGETFSTPAALTQKLLFLLNHPDQRFQMGAAAEHFVRSQPAATQIIVQKIREI